MVRVQKEVRKDILDNVESLYIDCQMLEKQELTDRLRKFIDWFISLERMKADTPRIDPTVSHCKADSIEQ